MAVCLVIDTGETPEEYDEVRSRLGVDASSQLPGGVVHIAAKGDDGKIRIVQVWDRGEQAEEWMERVRPVREELGLSASTSTAFEVYRLIK